MTAQGNSPDGNGQGQTASESGQAGGLTSEWGRVDPDGTVYVRTADGERAVGQYPEGTPEEALAFFTRRFDALAFEVQLLEQRVRAEALSPDEATESIKQVAAQLVEPNAVGDVVGLSARLDALGPLIGLQRGQRRADRARKLEEAHTRKQEIVAEAEKISQGKDWRNGVNRLRDLLEEWKALPRLERKRDDELWHRFSSARTSYTRRRKTHFAELGEKREGARVVKQRLLKEAEELSTSTEWGPTSSRFRTLMRTGRPPAPRRARSRKTSGSSSAPPRTPSSGPATPPTPSRTASSRPTPRRRRSSSSRPRSCCPVTDLEAAKRAFRDIADRWDAAGKVPRDQMKSLEARIRKVEQAIRSTEDDKWRRSDPEKSARADDMLGQLERAISDIETNLDKARAAGDDRKVRELEENLASRQQFLEMARKAACDFS